VHSAYLPIWVRLLGSLDDRWTEDRCFWSVVSTNSARYQMSPICSKQRGPEANRTTQTHCNSPAWPFWGTLHVWTTTQMPRGLEETKRTPPHHMVEHHTAGSEILQSHIAWTNGYGLEPVSMEDVVDVWRCAILSCMPEMTTTTKVHIPIVLNSFATITDTKHLTRDPDVVQSSHRQLWRLLSFELWGGRHQRSWRPPCYYPSR